MSVLCALFLGFVSTGNRDARAKFDKIIHNQIHKLHFPHFQQLRYRQ